MNNVEQKCKNCKFFEARTRFCRFNPPLPVIMDLGNGLATSSKFPVITKPEVDWCAKFEYFQEN